MGEKPCADGASQSSRNVSRSERTARRPRIRNGRGREVRDLNASPELQRERLEKGRPVAILERECCSIGRATGWLARFSDDELTPSVLGSRDGVAERQPPAQLSVRIDVEKARTGLVRIGAVVDLGGRDGYDGAGFLLGNDVSRSPDRTENRDCDET